MLAAAGGPGCSPAQIQPGERSGTLGSRPGTPPNRCHFGQVNYTMPCVEAIILECGDSSPLWDFHLECGDSSPLWNFHTCFGANVKAATSRRTPKGVRRSERHSIGPSLCPDSAAHRAESVCVKHDEQLSAQSCTPPGHHESRL